MVSLRRLITCLLTLAALGLVSGCGKKGPLIPPEALAPAPITTLAVAQKGERFEVSWPVPSKQEGGARLTDLAGFILFRRPVLPPAEDCEECPTAYRELARIDVEVPRGARRVGNHFLYDDTDLERGKTYQYKVRSFIEDGTESKDSNKVRRLFVIPPSRPTVEAIASETSVVLSFAVPGPLEGTVTGFNLYRIREGGGTPPAPLAVVPAAAARYEDNEVLVGSRYIYWATTVAKVNGEVVESIPSKVVSLEVTPRD